MKILVIIFHYILITNITRLIVISTNVRLDSNGRYSDLLIAIDESVSPNDNLIDIIKSKFTKASANLKVATKRKDSGGLSFKTIYILLPDQWRTTIRSSDISDWQTFDSADIRIYHSTNITHNLPTTMHNRGCGHPGQYTRYTDYYFLHEELLEQLDDGPFSAPPEKMIIHQWAHYRWGVFDEHPNKFFPAQLYSRGGNIEPVRCSQKVEGKFWSKYGPFCKTNPFVPDKSCTFSPHRNSTSRGSLMFSPQVSSVIKFCDSNSEDEDLKHNPHAPNQHNIMCGGASVWDVMRRHNDFSRNYPENVDTAPNFRIIQRKKKKSPRRSITLVMCISGSMPEKQIENVNTAVQYFIEHIEPRARLVSLNPSSSNSVLQSLVNVKTDKLKNSRRSETPSNLDDISQALGGIMNNPGQSFDDSDHVIVITAGEPYTFNRVIQILQRSDAAVNSISIDKRTIDAGLVGQTKGNYFMADSESSPTSMIENLISSQGSRIKRTIRTFLKIISLGTISVNHPPKLIATMDRYSRQEMKFIFKTLPYVDAVVISPSGVQYSKSSSSSIYSTSIIDTMTTITVVIPGNAEVGEWTAQMLTHSGTETSDINSGFLVLTQRSISIKCKEKVKEFQLRHINRFSKCEYYMRISYNRKAITGANVNLQMEYPSKIKKKFIMEEHSKGLYSVTLLAYVFNEVGIYTPRIVMIFKVDPSDKFSVHQSDLQSAIKVITPYTTAIDMTDPALILGVRLEVIDSKKRLLRLTFKAVGDDEHRNRASHYEFKINDIIFNRTDFDIKASEPGTLENITLPLNKIKRKMNLTSFYIRIRAVDDANNKGLWTKGYFVNFQDSDNNRSKPSVQSQMACNDIIPPTWNYRCIVKVNVTAGSSRPITDANVTMEIIDPLGNRKAVPMYNNRFDCDPPNGIYKSSIIGRDFSVKGEYRISANVTFHILEGKISKLINKSIQIGRLNCAGRDNPRDQTDNFPPDQIRIVSIRLLGKSFKTELKFIAVGDDGDRLKVNNYEIQANGIQLIQNLPYPTPKKPGELESVTVKIEPPNVSNSIVEVRVRAVDRAQNRGVWSGPATIRFISSQ